MTEYLNIGSTPYNEPCAQVGSPDYNKQSIIECRALANQCNRVLIRKFGTAICILRIRSFSHDFGTYKEVCAFFNEDNREELEQALYLESTQELETWDREALEELKERNYNVSTIGRSN